MQRIMMWRSGALFRTGYCGLSGWGAALILALAMLGEASAQEKEAPTIGIRLLSPALANQVASAALAECTKRGFKVSVAVVGRDGHLVAFLRNPLSGVHTVLTSQRKAYTAASLQVPTSQMMAREDLRFAPGILLIVGGVPIIAGSGFYGAVAVAGAEPEVDELCARAGVEAVSETLEFAQ